MGSISAGLPIWTGGRVPRAVRAAARDVDAGEQSLRDTVADVIAQVAGAYADMLVQQQAVAIAHADIALLDSQVGEARARFDLGTGTRTDGPPRHPVGKSGGDTGKCGILAHVGSGDLSGSRR